MFFLFFFGELFTNCLQLLVQAPENRLGRNGASQIKQHLFFKGICWEALANRTIPAPFIPEVVFLLLISLK